LSKKLPNRSFGKMKKIALIATICIVLALVATPIVPVSQVTASPSTLQLWVNAYDDTKAAWTKVGASPYLDAQDLTNEGWVEAAAQEWGDFDFADSAASGTIHSVNLYIYGYCDQPAKNPEAYVWDGSSWTAYLILFTNSYGWANVDISLLIDTWPKINGAKIYLRSLANKPTHADAAYLLVDYTAWDTWNSYESDYSTSCEDYNTGTSNTIYMKGTGFETGSYDVTYFDADDAFVGTDANITISGGQDLLSSLACNTDPAAAEGTWYARVYPSGGTTLIAEDTFFVNANVIPEFPTIFAAIGVAGLCFGIYWWMKRRLVYVKA